MSKDFRPWKIDEAQLLPANVQDYVPKDHLCRFILALVREELDLSAIAGSYRSGASSAFEPSSNHADDGPDDNPVEKRPTWFHVAIFLAAFWRTR